MISESGIPNNIEKECEDIPSELKEWVEVTWRMTYQKRLTANFIKSDSIVDSGIKSNLINEMTFNLFTDTGVEGSSFDKEPTYRVDDVDNAIFIEVPVEKSIARNADDDS